MGYLRYNCMRMGIIISYAKVDEFYLLTCSYLFAILKIAAALDRSVLWKTENMSMLLFALTIDISVGSRTWRMLDR